MFKTRSRLKNTRVEGFEWVRSVWGERKDLLSREKSEKWIWFALRLYKEIVAWWIEVSVEICQALNLNRNKSVEVLLRICCRQKSPWWIEQFVENLSSRQRAQEFFFMDRRSCRDSIEMKPRNFDGLRISRGFIVKRERRLDRKRIYWGSVEKMLS